MHCQNSRALAATPLLIGSWAALHAGIADALQGYMFARSSILVLSLLLLGCGDGEDPTTIRGGLDTSPPPSGTERCKKACERLVADCDVETENDPSAAYATNECLRDCHDNIFSDEELSCLAGASCEEPADHCLAATGE